MGKCQVPPEPDLQDLQLSRVGGELVSPQKVATGGDKLRRYAETGKRCSAGLAETCVKNMTTRRPYAKSGDGFTYTSICSDVA